MGRYMIRLLRMSYRIGIAILQLHRSCIFLIVYTIEETLAIKRSNYIIELSKLELYVIFNLIYFMA